MPAAEIQLPDPEPGSPVANPSLQSNLLQGSTGTILNAIANAEAHVERQELQFPRIAVFGDESTGKSSVLEAICRIPFPQGSTTTTRCPIQVRILRKPGANWSAKVWNGSDRSNEKYATNPKEVTSYIRQLQEENINNVDDRGGAKFSQTPITVLVEADDVIDLTLLDLPGYFTHQGRDPSEPEGDVTRIKNALMDCMQDERTIMLVILRANQVFKTANIFNLLKEYERTLTPEKLLAFRARTINCVTMCDLVSGRNAAQGPAQDIETILSNEGPFATKPHGWFAVVNNKGRASNGDDHHAKLVLDRREERAFFDITPPYNRGRFRPLCGVENLIQKLSSILSQEISKFIPSMLDETGKALSAAKMELSKCGPAPQQDRNISREFNNIIADILSYYEKVGNGEYDGVRSQAPKQTPRKLLDQCELGHLRRLRYNRFAEEVEKERLKVGEKQYLRELLDRVNKARDGRLEESIPVKMVIIEEFRRCAVEWKNSAERLCEDIAGIALRCLHILVDIRVQRYQMLPGILKDQLCKVINEQKEKAMNRLEWHYVDEISRPDTLNKGYKELIKQTNFPSLGKDTKSNAEAYNKNLELYFRFAEPRYIDNVVRTITTHIFDVPLNGFHIRTKLERDFKYVFQAPEIQEGHKLEDLMKIRDDLEKQRNKVEVKVLQLENLRDTLRDHEPSNSSWEAEMVMNGYDGVDSVSSVVHGSREGSVSTSQAEDNWARGETPTNPQARAGTWNPSIPEDLTADMESSPPRVPYPLPPQAVPGTLPSNRSGEPNPSGYGTRRANDPSEQGYFQMGTNNVRGGRGPRPY